MPAVSKKQQRFFGIVRAIQKGEMAPTTPETAKAAADMKKSDVKDFASTKHKKLPEKVVSKEETKYDKYDKEKKQFDFVCMQMNLHLCWFRSFVRMQGKYDTPDASPLLIVRS